MNRLKTNIEWLDGFRKSVKQQKPPVKQEFRKSGKFNIRILLNHKTSGHGKIFSSIFR